MKIKVVIPNSGMSRGTLNARELMLSHAVSPAVIISVDCIPSGPRAIESNTDEVLAGHAADAAVQAERDGYDAFVVYCFSDLAVDAIRENVSIPVVGPGEVALAAADIVANRFAVITTVEENISRTYRRLMQNAVAQRKMSSVRALNIPVVALREDPKATMRYLNSRAASSAQASAKGAGSMTLTPQQRSTSPPYCAIPRQPSTTVSIWSSSMACCRTRRRT